MTFYSPKSSYGAAGRKDNHHRDLEYYSMSAEERHAYDEHINAIMIQNDVISTTQLEGRQQEKKETTRKMKLKGIPAETIAETTELSLTEIESL